MPSSLATASRPLGKTGLMVHPIALGTVSLGTDYGIAAPGEFGRPEEKEAILLIREAADAGITLFDTAPAYGEAERLLGEAIGNRPECVIATKVTVPENLQGRPLAAVLEKSLVCSLRALRRESLDIVQVHNASVEVLDRGEATAFLLDACRRGLVRHLGASVYTEEEALAVIGTGAYEVLQVAFNLLDQRMGRKVFAEAERGRVGILSRSTFFKGVLTAKARWLPAALSPLRDASGKVVADLAGSWDGLPAVALRFCLSIPALSSVLVGPRTRPELGVALAALSQGPLSDAGLAIAARLGLADDRLLNPSHWPVA